MFPLKPIGLFIKGEKLTSETGDQLRFWAHLQLAREFYADQGILTNNQFDEIDWRSVHHTLHNLPWLFQVWAAKQVLNIAGMMKFLSYQDGQCKLCSSCQQHEETCHHVAGCPEVEQKKAFDQSTDEVEQWLESNTTHPDLQRLLMQYLRGHGTVTCIKCSMGHNLPQIMQDVADSQDKIGWDNFVMGMVSKKLLQVQSAHLLQCNSARTARNWISGLITQLLQVTHSQWIYRCVLVHDRSTVTLLLAHKEELQREIEHQLTLGPEGLAEDDRFLLECNFGELVLTNGEHQEYWLLAIWAAREEDCLRVAKRQRSTTGTVSSSLGNAKKYR